MNATLIRSRNSESERAIRFSRGMPSLRISRPSTNPRSASSMWQHGRFRESIVRSTFSTGTFPQGILPLSAHSAMARAAQ